ncbi:TPA: hypothetical protein ACH3X2_013364 [Trebouxia sp. C0005]
MQSGPQKQGWEFGRDSVNGADIESGATISATPDGGERLSKHSSVMALLVASPVVVFSKSRCPFCFEALRLLQQYAVPVDVQQLDEMPNGAQLQGILKKQYKHHTVPCIFINSVLIGGCDDLVALHKSGALQLKLEKALIQHGSTGTPLPSPKSTAPAGISPSSAVDIDQDRPARSLFWFPDVVDNRAGRIVACMTSIISLLAIIFRRHQGMHWATLGLFVDFLIRLVAGPGPSVLTQLARLPLACMKPQFTYGLPQQTAVFLGVCFTGLASLLFFLPLGDHSIAGAVVMAMLLGASVLYGVFNYCAACTMFGLGIWLGLLPRTVHSAAINTKVESGAMWDYGNQRSQQPKPVTYTQGYPGHGPTHIDLKYKVKTDEYTMQNFDIIKYCHLNHFASMLGLAGLAVVWQVASQAPYDLHISATVFKVIVVLAAVLFVVLLALYAAKAAVYPKKVSKEWQCPMRSNSFSIPFMILMLFAYVMDGQFHHSHKFAQVIFWIGAVGVLMLAFIKVGDWISHRFDVEHVSAAWLVAPVGGPFVMALVAPAISRAYVEAALFGFGFALIMWLVLFTMTFQRAITAANADDRHRPAMWMWVAAPAIACLAYNSIVGETDGNGALTFDNVSKSFMFMALSLFFCLGWGFVRGFFGRSKFDMADWGYSFPVDVLAICLIQYSGDVRGSWTRGMAYTAITIATGLGTFLRSDSLHSLCQSGKSGCSGLSPCSVVRNVRQRDQDLHI